MKRPITFAHGLATLGFWALAAAAAAAGGPAAALPDPADERAAVPATRYEPLLKTTPATAPASMPPENWKALNRAVASIDSMSLTMDMQGSAPARPEGHAQHAQHAQHAATPPGEPAAQLESDQHKHMEHK